MSKRNSVGASNTLFNYFTKTPPASKKTKRQNEESEACPKIKLENNDAESKIENKKRERQPSPPPEVRQSDSEDEVQIAPKKRKRIRLNPLDSDDSDTENKLDNKITIVKEKTSVGKTLQDSFSYETTNSPKEKRPAPVRPTSTPVKTEPVERDAAPVVEEGNWIHCKLDWLKPGRIRDAQRRRPDHPDYDPTTLYVPPDFIKVQTPVSESHKTRLSQLGDIVVLTRSSYIAGVNFEEKDSDIGCHDDNFDDIISKTLKVNTAHKQWWEMKSSHFDCVLFFKVGKFYELYHMDAAVGVNELGFSFMRGEFAHSGFPESAYARMANTLVSKGYKVARVEQTETPEMMQERCRKTSKNSKTDKVVRREICQVTLRGTQVCGLQDPGPSEHHAAYMVALAEEEGQGCSTYGICFVDTSIGLFHLGQFKDDKHSSRLLTTLAHFPPALIVLDRKSITPRTSKLLSTHCHSARLEPHALWTPERTLKTLAEKYYRTNEDGDWPEGLKEFLHEGDALGLTPAANCSLAIKALGGCVSYLTDCLLDVQILGMSQFTSYEPPDVLNRTLSQEEKVSRWAGGSTMILDAITLRNLRIVQDEGCLFDKLNFCSTPMGKRLLYQWVCAPRCNLTAIRQRQEAVRSLFDNQELCQDVKNILNSLPDLERLLAKVHSLGNLLKSKTHPDSRAIFYEEKIYSKRKVLDFISVLNGFTAALKLADLFRGTDSALLKTITQLKPQGKFPDYRDTLKFFKEGFNQSEAEKEGRILPGAGVDAEYDNTIRTIKEIEEELHDYLKKQEKFFRCRVSYVGTDRKRFQLEVAQGAAAKAGSDYKLEGTRKGFTKFSTADTKEFLARMIAAEEQKTAVLKDLSRRIFEKFSSHYNEWEAAVQCVATLDILLAFAEFARQQPTDVCLPEVTFDNDTKPFIKIVEGRHPCIPVVNDFIPNDTELGLDNASLLLLTGPNMGGKSTLMRQVGLLTVLAHLGCYVPAQECRLSLVDRIFTRLGASDDILSGQSTFLVEMNETAAIVRHATEHSLVLLDELGRGTSTYDGTAIASGVCAELATRGCRVVFSTHYHALVHHLGNHPGVVLGHMACMVETDESTPDSEDHIPEETITFLYKLSPGACPKSYGFNAARLAGIPKEITRRAHLISRNLEKEATRVRAFRDIFKKDASDVRALLAGLSI